MKKLCALFLTLMMILSAGCLTAFAADTEEEKDPGVLADVLGALDSAYVGADFKLYVKANKGAGLSTNTKVRFNGTDFDGAVYFPGNVDPKGMKFFWNDPDVILSKNGKTYKSGEAPIAPVGESISYQASSAKKKALLTIKTVRGSASVDAMFLTIDQNKGTIKAMNDDPDHETSCYGKAMFNGKTKYMGLKGRGNSTWVLPKKPYNITFYENSSYDDTDSVNLIQGVKAKKWSLLANYFDATLLRNKLAMDLAEDMGIGLKSKFVDLWVNGEYYGNYLLTPKNDYNTPESGYSLENDNYIEPGESFPFPGMFEIGSIPTVAAFGSGYYNRITLKKMGDKAEAKGENLQTIEKYFNQASKALYDYSSEEYQNYFDLESWSKMYLMYEVSKTYDAYAGSILMHRDGLTKNDKLIAGPAWDYDVAFGRTLHKFFVGISEPMQLDAEGWYLDHIGVDVSNQPISLLQELGKHKSFRNQVAKTFIKYQWAFNALPSNVTHQQKLLQESALMNNERWLTNNLNAEYVVAPKTMSNLGTGKYKLDYHITTTWNDYCFNLREYCTKRVLWLSDNT